MSLKLVIGVVLIAAQAASAERAIVTEVTAIAPFDANELTAALRVRLARDGAPVTVRVLAIPAGVRVEVSSTDQAIVRGGARDVSLEGLSGATAARMVALAASDLILDDLAMPAAVATTEVEPGRTTISMLGAAAAWDDVFGGATVDLARSRGRWLVAIEGGGATLVGGSIGLTAAMIRLSGGLRLGWFELRAGGTVAPLIVSDGAGDRTVLVGAGASARVRVTVIDGLSAVFAAGGDVFATRTQYLVGGMPALATPRAAPWFGAGIEVTP